MQVLESASQRRATEPSSPANLQEVALSKITKPSGRRRAKSDTATARFNTSVTLPPDMPTSSPYSSPAEASYASLARSLAQASVAVRQASFVGGIHDYRHGIAQAALSLVPPHPEYHHHTLQSIETPWQQPASAFSDWGSSRNSMAAYTPTPSGQLEDPFEFDSPIGAQKPQSLPHSHVPIQDDFDMFAAAVEMNRYTRPFVMPAFPTNGLVRRRKLSPLCAERIVTPLSTKDRRDSCPPEVGDAPSTSQTQHSGGSKQQYPDTQSSIAARRKQSCPTLLSNGPQPSRIRSFKGALPVMQEEITPDAKPKRQSIEDTDHDSRACGTLKVEPTPFNLNIFNAIMGTGSCSSPKPLLHSSPRELGPLEDERALCCSPTPHLKQDIPDLEFTTSATPESATFDNHMPSVASLPDTYHMHLPEDRLYVHPGLSEYYDFPSEGSSASSGIILGKETNAFPFEEFLQARLNTTKVKPLDALGSQQAIFYNQIKI